VIKEFFISISVILSLVVFVFLHYITYSDNSSQSMLNSLVKVSKISSPSLSVAYYEPRILLYDDIQNPAYPQMQAINKMDLIYEQ
jgi:hypothetical protein